MKNKSLVIVLLILMMAISSFFVGCKEKTQPGVTSYEISLSQIEITLEVGESKKLYATYGPDGEVSFSSTDDQVVTVDDNGNVTAKDVGVVYIDVTAGQEKRTCKVTVVKSVFDIVFDCSDMKLIVGARKEIYATVTKNGVAEDVTVEWKVSPDGAIKVNENVAIFTASAKGEYKLTATYGDVSKTITIKVVEASDVDYGN